MSRILVVEDDPDIAELLRYYLERASHDVDVLSQGQAALARIRDRRPELVILDRMLPGMDGLEICRQLRATPESADILVIMVTARAEESDRIVGLELGADDYITKPFSAKEVVARVAGEGAFARLKYESGVHRVQRVPETESGGRIHTSAATVAVLPEAEEVDVRIDAGDLRIDTMRSSGAGGQHVNTTDSAVRITHIPSGIVVTSSEKSQHRNREIAMQVLRTRLYDLERSRVDLARSADRKSQVGSGDRSERIRTYNFPQGRMTDHRINLTLYSLGQIMQGDLDEMIDALTAHAQAELLAEMEA